MTQRMFSRSELEGLIQLWKSRMAPIQRIREIDLNQGDSSIGPTAAVNAYDQCIADAEAVLDGRTPLHTDVMQALLLADHLMESARSGEKTVTVRNGNRDIKGGLLCFTATNGTVPSLVVEVLRVWHGPINRMPVWARSKRTFSQVVKDLIGFYPQINHRSEITAIEFQATEDPMKEQEAA